MQKTLIFGKLFISKITLAKELSEQNDLAHLDLDTIAWDKETVTQREKLKE